MATRKLAGTRTVYLRLPEPLWEKERAAKGQESWSAWIQLRLMATDVLAWENQQLRQERAASRNSGQERGTL